MADFRLMDLLTPVLQDLPTYGWRKTHGILVSHAETPLLALAGAPHHRDSLDWVIHPLPFGDLNHLTLPSSGELVITGSVAGRQLEFTGVLSLDSPSEQLLCLLSEACELDLIEDGSGQRLEVIRKGPLCWIPLRGGVKALRVKWRTPPMIGSDGFALYSADAWLPQVLVPGPLGRITLNMSACEYDIVTNAVRIGRDQHTILPPDGTWAFLGSKAHTRHFVVYLKRGKVVRHSYGSALPPFDYSAELETMLAYFQNRLGVLPRLTLIAAPVREALAISLPGAIVVDPKLLQTPATMLFRYLPHELAHQWFGNRVRFEGPGSLWLQESLAEYLQLLYAAHRLGGAQLHRGLAWCLKTYQENWGSGVSHVTLMDCAVDRVPALSVEQYEGLLARGTLAWHRLWLEIGERHFLTVLGKLVHTRTAVRLDAFVKLVTRTTGINITSLVDEWLRRTDLPDVTFLGDARLSKKGG